MQPAVGANGVWLGAFARSKAWRVTNDDVPAVALLLLLREPRKGVGGHERVGGQVYPGELEALLCRAVGVRRDVDARNSAAGERRTLRKTSGVGKQVEDSNSEPCLPPTRDELADATAVFSLVEERAGLLPADEVDHEGHAVLAHPNGRPWGTESYIDALGLAFSRPLGRSLDERGDSRVAQEAFKVTREHRGKRPRGLAVDAQDRDVVVAVEDESRRSIPFAVEQSICRGRTVAEELSTHRKRTCEPFSERVCVKPRVCADDPHTHGDGRIGVENAAADGLVALRNELYHGGFARRRRPNVDRIFKDPRVASTDGLDAVTIDGDFR